VYGVELLNANALFSGTDAGKLLFDNEATGSHAELAIS
jgi:hypothetical protein